MDTKVPTTLHEALALARGTLTNSDLTVLRSRSREEASWSLHMTLGHELRNVLGLWTEAASPLYDDMMQRLPGVLVVDGDTASAVLIDALWCEQHGSKELGET